MAIASSAADPAPGNEDSVLRILICPVVVSKSCEKESLSDSLIKAKCG
jgi:hypothetical protein